MANRSSRDMPGLRFQQPRRTGVGGEQVVAGHARLAGHARGDDHQVCALQAVPQLILSHVRADRHRRVAVREVCCHARGARDVVERQLGYELVHLEEEGQRLADAATCTCRCRSAPTCSCALAPALCVG